MLVRSRIVSALYSSLSRTIDMKMLERRQGRVSPTTSNVFRIVDQGSYYYYYYYFVLTPG